MHQLGVFIVVFASLLVVVVICILNDRLKRRSPRTVDAATPPCLQMWQYNDWRAAAVLVIGAGALILGMAFAPRSVRWLLPVGGLTLAGFLLYYVARRILLPLAAVYLKALRTGRWPSWAIGDGEGKMKMKCPNCRTWIEFEGGKEGDSAFTCPNCGAAGKFL